MDTILQRRSEGHKDETQLKISAQVITSTISRVGLYVRPSLTDSSDCMFIYAR